MPSITQITLIPGDIAHTRAVRWIGMPEERVRVKGVLREVFLAGDAGDCPAMVEAVAVGMVFGLLTVAVAGTGLPLVRCAARWGVHGHAFATPRIGPGVAWCYSA